MPSRVRHSAEMSKDSRSLCAIRCGLAIGALFVVIGVCLVVAGAVTLALRFLWSPKRSADELNESNLKTFILRNYTASEDELLIDITTDRPTLKSQLTTASSNPSTAHWSTQHFLLLTCKLYL